MQNSTSLALVGACLGPNFPATASRSKAETVKIQDIPHRQHALPGAISKAIGKYGIKCQLQMIPSAPLGAQACCQNPSMSLSEQPKYRSTLCSRVQS